MRTSIATLDLHGILELHDSSKRYLGGLDIIRFCAAALVMMFHLAWTSWVVPGSPMFGTATAPRYPELSIFESGWVGVEIFFVLSGFVIAQSADGSSALRFVRGRAGRLLPSIWVCSTLTFAVVLVLGLSSLHEAFFNYVRTLVVAPQGPWISAVYWTLTLETVFYAMIALLLALNWFRHIEVVAIVLGSISAVYLVLVGMFDLPRVSQHLLMQHGCFFALGILLWIGFSRGATSIKWMFSSCFMAAGVVEIVLVSHDRLHGIASWFAPLIWLASIAAIVISARTQWPGTRLTRKLGLLTYPLYLVHPIIGVAILRVNQWTGRYVALFLAISIAVGLSWLIVGCERPIKAAIETCVDRMFRGVAAAGLGGFLSKETVPV